MNKLMMKVGMLLLGVLVLNNAQGAVIHPVASSPQTTGEEFWVEIEVNGVSNLFGVSFVLSYDTIYLDVVAGLCSRPFRDVTECPNPACGAGGTAICFLSQIL